MTDRLRRFAGEIAFAVVPALIAAALHLGIVTVRRELFNTGQWDWNTRDIGWMIPAGYLLVFAVCALPLAVVASIRRAGVPQRTRVWFWSSLTAFAVLLLFTRVHSAAWLLVALGVGYQGSAWATRHSAAWRRGIKRTGIALGIGFIAVAVIAFTRRSVKEHTLLAALPNAPAAPPNVLLIIWDTVRAQRLSLYGYSRPTTPFLDSLARHAVVFDHAYSTAPWTLPSHASMLTGQYPGTLSANWRTRLDEKPRTLPETLYEQGYTTGAFVANSIAAAFHSGLHRGFVRYEDTQRTFREAWLSTTLTQADVVQSVYVRLVKQRWYSGALRELLRFNWRPFDTYQAHSEKPAVSVTAEFIGWQASVRRPYFAMLNYMEAHSGVAFPTRAMFGAGAKRQDEYDGAIWWLDHELRALISHLQQRGELEQTIIIVTSDHGEQFGEHGLNGHGNSLYSLELHVPLVMYAPSRLPGGVRISRAVSLRDIARTVQELTNVRAEVLPGASLAALATSPQTETSPVIAQVSRSHNHPPRQPLYWGDMISVFDDSLHVIRDGRGAIQAYAYRRDVEEKNDLAQDALCREQAAQLLNEALRSAGLGH